MEVRTQREINEIGYRALVNALGREDASRFIEQFGRSDADRANEPEDARTLPPFTPDQIHELIRSMQEPSDQASFL